MIILLTVLHVLIAILLIVAVLMQSGKGGGLAASIGGGLSSSSVLGGRTAATFLTKTTTVLATAFLVSCLLQSFIIKTGPDDVPMTAMERVLEDGGGQPPPIPFSPLEESETPSVLGGSEVGDGTEGPTE